MASSELQWEIPKKLCLDLDNAVGIDLGTTRCCCAVSRKEGIVTVALDNIGERLLPSYVAYDEEKEKCGQLVVNRLRNYSKSTVFDIKRIIGKSFVDIQDNIDQNWTFAVESDFEGNPVIITKNVREELRLSPIEPSATLLNHIKIKAEEFQDKKLQNVVITVPAVFNDQQREATVLAGQLAGWETIELLPEPVAAALSYFIDRPFANNSTLLLFDLGGGTLDVCVFKIVDDQIRILSNDGDSKLGGRDFDNILVSHFRRKLENDFNIEKNKGCIEQNKYKLLCKCHEIKTELSVLNEKRFDVDDIDVSKDDAYIIITRDEFECLVLGLLERIRNKINMALKSINRNDISEILLVGGGSKMPMIKKLLEDMFPKVHQRCTVNPDEAVARGAAYYACHLLSNHQGSTKLVWEANFARGSINPLKFKFQNGKAGWGNNELQYYRSENACVKNGVLYIEARREHFKNCSFTSARLSTKGMMEFKYGILEARIKLPSQKKGLWPSFNTLGANDDSVIWPACGQIVILATGSAEDIADDVVNNRVRGAAHWEDGAMYPHFIDADFDLSADFHVYKLKWTDASIIASIDDKPHFTMNIPTNAFRKPHYVNLHLAVGGNFSNIHDPNQIDAQFPAQMQIDYIRLYQEPGDELYINGQ